MTLQVNNVLLLLKLRKELEPIGYTVKMNRKTKSGELMDEIILHIKWAKDKKNDRIPKDYAMVEFHKDNMTVSKVLGDDYPIMHWVLARFFKTTLLTQFRNKPSIRRKRRAAVMARVSMGPARA